MSKCIVTLAIGTEFANSFKKYCFPGWREYANKFGYDLFVITDSLDKSERAQGRSPAWQKCLVWSLKELKKYDQLVWIDADIIINSRIAPSICDFIRLGQIGGVKDFSYPTEAIALERIRIMYKQWAEAGIKYVSNPTPNEFYKKYGIDTQLDEVFQTGVIVASPKFHSEIFRYAYYNYEEIGGAEWNYEMRPLSYELVRSGLVKWIPNEFNLCVSEYTWSHYNHIIGSRNMNDFLFAQYTAAYNNSYFCHFAGCGMKKIEEFCRRS